MLRSVLKSVRYSNTYAPKPIMELEIGCFEYSMELEKAIGYVVPFSKIKQNSTLRETSELPEVTRVSKIETHHRRWPNVEKREASRHVRSLMPLAYNTFSQDKIHIHGHWALVEHSLPKSHASPH